MCTLSLSSVAAAHPLLQVRLLDYWNMNVTVVATVEGAAASVSIDVPYSPMTYEVARKGGY